MSDLERWLAELGTGQPAMALLFALVLGLRHATDPDHLTAVATLVFGENESMARRAGLLGLAWGFGHAVTLMALGLPVLLLHAEIPPLVHRAAEVVVGLLIVGLAVRLLVRWRRGTLHTHPHRHGDVWHAHPHAHELRVRLPGFKAGPARNAPHPSVHQHPHSEGLGRTPAAAFGIGLVHGVGGSAMVSVVLVAAFPTAALGAAALTLLALGTALSMGLLSALLGGLLGGRRHLRWLEAVIPLVGVASLAFGAWYVAAAAMG